MNQLGRCIHMLAGALILALAGTLHSQTTIRVASGLRNPLYVTSPPDDPNRLFIVEQGVSGSARIKILDLTNYTVNTTPFLTIDDLWTGVEQGLLGMAFDPNYAANGTFYVNVTAPLGRFDAGITQIRQYTVSANPNIAETTFTTVLSLDKPQANHNGGWIGFSPRAGETNNLYIAMGDGGNANDQGLGHSEPGGNAQNTGSLFGKILRIQVDPATGTYTIPANNPFGNEVFTYGLRNRFRVSFDRKTGDMFIGDVGQGSREEIDRQLASNPNGGKNYGWRLREGTIQTPASVGGPPPSNSVDPILDYDRNVGTTITGGYVYRGGLAPNLEGKYIFGDFGAGKIFMANADGTDFQDATSLFDPTGTLRISNPSSFGEDAAGELYIVDYSQGAVFLIVPEPGITDLLGLTALGCLVVATRYRARGIARHHDYQLLRRGAFGRNGACTLQRLCRTDS